MSVAQNSTEGLGRCWFHVSLTRGPFWYRIFEPQPYDFSTELPVV